MTEVTFPPSHQSSEAHLSSRWLNRPKITVLRARKKIVKLMQNWSNKMSNYAATGMVFRRRP